MQLIIFNKLYKDYLIIIKYYYYFFHITVMRMRLFVVGNCIKRYLFIYSPESELPLIWIALTQLLRYVFTGHVEQSGPHLTADLVAQQTSFTDGHASQSGPSSTGVVFSACEISAIFLFRLDSASINMMSAVSTWTLSYHGIHVLQQKRSLEMEKFTKIFHLSPSFAQVFLLKHLLPEERHD